MSSFCQYLHLLSTFVKQDKQLHIGVLRVGGIPVAILPSCQDMKTIALQLLKHGIIMYIIKWVALAIPFKLVFLYIT